MSTRSNICAVLIASAREAADTEQAQFLRDSTVPLAQVGHRDPRLLALVLRDRLGNWRPDDAATLALANLGFTFPEGDEIVTVMARGAGIEHLDFEDQLEELERLGCLHPCGHVLRVSGCGGCDPSAIEYVIEDGVGLVRPFDPQRDLEGATT